MIGRVKLSKKRCQHSETADVQKLPTGNILFQTVPTQSYNANCHRNIPCLKRQSAKVTLKVVSKHSQLL